EPIIIDRFFSLFQIALAKRRVLVCGSIIISNLSEQSLLTMESDEALVRADDQGSFLHRKRGLFSMPK
ncbi:hypothetical protein, partial [Enterococcus canis]